MSKKRSDIFYNPEMQDYIRERWIRLEDEEIANQLNKIYGGHITKVHIRVWRVENGLVSNKFLCHYHKSIRKLIKRNRLQKSKILKQKIFDELGYDIPFDTVRTNKRNYGCTSPSEVLRSTCLKIISKEFPEWPKDKTCKEFYAHIQKIILEKTGRTVALDTIRHYKNDLKLFKGQIKGWKVKKTVQCKYCGKDITITLRNPNQKYCCRACAHAGMSKEAQLKHYAEVTDKDIKQLIKRWKNYAKAIIHDSECSLYQINPDEVFADFVYCVPGAIVGLRKKLEKVQESEKENYSRTYVGKVVENCVRRAIKKAKKERKNIKFLQDYCYQNTDKLHSDLFKALRETL